MTPSNNTPEAPAFIPLRYDLRGHVRLGDFQVPKGGIEEYPDVAEGMFLVRRVGNTVFVHPDYQETFESSYADLLKGHRHMKLVSTEEAEAKRKSERGTDASEAADAALRNSGAGGAGLTGGQTGSTPAGGNTGGNATPGAAGGGTGGGRG